MIGARRRTDYKAINIVLRISFSTFMRERSDLDTKYVGTVFDRQARIE